MTKMYVASCVLQGGIYLYDLETLEKKDYTPIKNPMFLAIDNKKMYVVSDNERDFLSSSDVVCYDIDKNGKLENLTEIGSTNGICGCHIAVSNGDIYCVNYLSGSAIKMPDSVVVHTGSGINKTRQNTAHTHQAAVTPDKKYVLITDLGLDKIMVYDRDMNFVSSASVPKGAGARHVAFSNCGRYVYCVNELDSSVSSFKYFDGKLEYIDTFCGFFEKCREGTTAAAIRVSGDDRFVYTSNRGDNTISCFKAEGGKLKLFDVVFCGGDFPRDMNISPGGDIMVCTNEKSDDITFLNIDKNTGGVTPSGKKISVPHPLCVIFD